jgi:long-chain acyl-CoA synthetase
MRGYLGQPAFTAAAFADGYFRTGDLAWADEEGIVTMISRMKEVISRGGNKIYPQEIELALQTHPSIAEVLAAGVADPLMGQRIHVAIRLKQGAALDAAALRRWASERLEKFKIPAAPARPIGSHWRIACDRTVDDTSRRRRSVGVHPEMRSPSPRVATSRIRRR